jgi:L-fuconolactonase
LRIDSHHSFTGRYPLDHLATILKRNRFEGSILVGPEAWPVPDSEMVRAVVPPLDVARLDEYRSHPKFRGVICDLQAGVPDGLEELERRGLTLDVVGGLERVSALAEQFPSLNIAIAHLGAPPGDDWPRDLERAAQCPRVFCKLSGVARLAPSPRPYVQRALAVFGPKRLMFGSDWPAGLPDVTWKASLAAFTQAIGAQTIEVREELLGATAARFYRLDDKLE